MGQAQANIEHLLLTMKQVRQTNGKPKSYIYTAITAIYALRSLPPEGKGEENNTSARAGPSLGLRK